MENEKFYDEFNDKEIVLELLDFSTILLLYMTDDIQEDIQFYRRAGMVIAWDDFDVCDKEILLGSIKHPWGFFTFLISIRRSDEEIVSRLNYRYLEIVITLILIDRTLGTERLGKIRFYTIYILIYLYHF